jgi:hypothetical protein
MFNRNSRSRSGVVWPAVLSVLMMAALAVAADNPRNPLDAASASAAPPAEKGFQVRCWQYGRLLFEESDLQLPPEVTGGLKLRGTDRNRQPVYITDTGSSTCLIRSVQVRR